MLYQKFQSFANIHQLFNRHSKILLAVSGGIDSMVMMRLFHRLGMDCTVAHCNFQLRGDESDQDEAFVREKAADLNFAIFVTRFETSEYAEENKLSVQMAARELRYTWFEKLAKVHHFDFIAVAHNREDSLETFFINLGRGTGISGLTGIRPLSGKIMRPLLFASRLEIAEYATENVIKFREDSSNINDKYLRNYIRHQVIPAMEEVFPKFRETLNQTLEKLSDANLIMQASIQNIAGDIVTVSGDGLSITIDGLLKTPAPKTVLFEILRPYNFTSVVVEEIFHSLEGISGKKFFSTNYLVVKDRNCLLVLKHEELQSSKYYIDEDVVCVEEPLKLTFIKEDYDETYVIERNADIALLDYDKLSFPLILRKWHLGDYFIPLGMSGMKKVSDFFIDRKLSIIQKQHTWILTSADQIVWIAGLRIDDRFKITPQTRKVLKVAKL